MALLTIGVCPEILTEDLLNIFRRELNIQTVKDFLSTEPQKMIDSVAQIGRHGDTKKLTDKILTHKDIYSIRVEIFSKFSIVARNVGEEFSNGSLSERDYISTGLPDLVRHPSFFYFI